MARTMHTSLDPLKHLVRLWIGRIMYMQLLSSQGTFLNIPICVIWNNFPKFSHIYCPIKACNVHNVLNCICKQHMHIVIPLKHPLNFFQKHYISTINLIV